MFMPLVFEEVVVLDCQGTTDACELWSYTLVQGIMMRFMLCVVELEPRDTAEHILFTTTLSSAELISSEFH
ncbi:hypothetical protein EYF80_038803 [Liparis tanakae]|uniref:Uncharacterized protein n=1 Tax=Liparis tanakae TaxID=230148 RepID=A0A4Z2GCN6_9TELE|nr:hypothetical protein EYF80_038803 [Liparis tanakae]